MKLLMVDDEEYVVESIRKNVDWERQGIDEIYSASSMKQAQRIMEMVPIDIIISDIVMPRQSGFDFIQWVRDNKYTVQVIFLTSYAEFDYARHAIAMNSVDYLLKPIDYDKLAAAVGRAAEKVKEARTTEPRAGCGGRTSHFCAGIFGRNCCGGIFRALLYYPMRRRRSFCFCISRSMTV